MIESGLYAKGLMSKLAPNALSPNYRRSKSKLEEIAEQRLIDTSDLDRPISVKDIDIDELDKPTF